MKIFQEFEEVPKVQEFGWDWMIYFIAAVEFYFSWTFFNI